MRLRIAIVMAVALVVATGIGLIRQSSNHPQRPPAPAAHRATPDPVRAATRFLVGLDLRTVLNPRRRRGHVERWSSRRAADQLQEIYAAEAERLQALRDGVARVALVGHRLRRRTSTRASVEIWAVSLASTEQAPPITSWRTVAVDLVFERDRWRVEKVREAQGPALDLPPRAFRARARQFRSFDVTP